MRRLSKTTFVVVLVIIITPLFVVSSIDETVEIDAMSIEPSAPHQVASLVEIIGEEGWINGNYSGSGTQE
ncbi:MAG: hypothetical protein ACXACT_16220, partial [Candidatus Thorarchaeota archaeon]